MSWPERREDYLALATALRSLVGGRQDVAARFFHFKDDDRVVKGWGPWKGKRVPKGYEPGEGESCHLVKNYKTKQIENVLLKPLSVENIVLHLRGRERLGVYVLDKESRCSFLAADFDDHEGKLNPSEVWGEALRFWESCEANDWTAHIERSKSGTGYHVWLFFDEPVEAAKARAIGKWLFQESQTLRDNEDFSTFDRFFPAQSQLAPGAKGFGNLIGLPLSGQRDYEAGRCAWMDPETGKPIVNPFSYTLNILERGRNPASRMDEFMAEWELTPEEGSQNYEGGPRDPAHPLGTPAEFEQVRQRCAFIPWPANSNNWDRVTEPLWFSWVSNLCRFEGADDWLHKVSHDHPHYDPVSTDYKLEHARSNSGPRTCRVIKEDGFNGCPADGCKLPNGEVTKSPAGLAAWASPKRGGRTNRAVSLSPDELDRHGERDWQDDIPINDETGQPWPDVGGAWEICNDGVIHRTERGAELIALRPLWVDALTRSSAGLWGVALRFFDLDWHYRSLALPRDRLHEQGGVLGRELALQGLPVVPGKEKWLSRFIVLQEGQVAKRIRAAGRLGWFDAPESPACFVMPDTVIGSSAEEIVYQPDMTSHTADTLHSQGKLADWQKQVADQCRGNPVLMFSIMLALAGPLLKPCQEQSGGFHLYGVTTGGKTTAAQVAASVWGCGADPQEGPEVTSIRKWYATGNALEGVAEVHNDTLLTLDEIGEVDPAELGRIIYQLAGGLSKSRANAGGGLRAQKTWRLLFFSTGEKSVRQMLAQVGQDAKGGQRVRLPDIPADDSETGDRSIVVDAHGKDPKDYVQDLKSACARYYGLAGPVLVAYLIAQMEAKGVAVFAGQLREELKRLELRLSEGLEEIPPEGRRVLRRLALTALAGWYASGTMAGIVDWTLEDIFAAVRNIRDRWLSEQGTERSETDRGLAHLRGELIANQDRIRPYDHSGAGYRNILGFRLQDYYLLTEKGLQELCGQFDMRTLLRALKTRNLLWHDTGRLTKKSPKIEGYGDRRLNLYWISVDFLGEQDHRTTEEDIAARKPEAFPGKQGGQRELGEGEKIPF